ncbi:kinase-like domain-containing protein [Pilobolus umbonatus]|nr:kinase-like domain-containing protein [Pilobolus umbonatus]
MFETHKDNVHKKEQEEDKLFDDIVPDVDSGDQPDDFSNDNDFNDIQEPWQNDEGDNIYYIIEPQNGGGLYTYGDGRPLEKLPFTINQIVTNSPFRTQDGTTYLGKKSTIMLAIDPRTGNILQKFDLNEIENVETIATQTHLPPRTLFLGRNEYKVAIYYNNKKRWNVTYSEYIPNKLDWDMPNSAVPSDIYIAPDANHAITGINVRNVSIFDVYRREDFTITVTKQDPPKALDKGIIGDMMSVIQRGHGISTAYVGVHEGTLYALSTKNYPLMQISKWASMYTGRKPGDHQQLIEGGSRNNASFPETEWKQMPHELCCRGCEYHVDCLIGQHVVQSLVEEDELNKRLYLPTSLPQYPSQMPLYADTKEGFFYDGYGKFWKSYVLVSSVLVYVYRDRVQTFYKVRILPKWKKIMKKHSRAKKTRARINAVVKAEKEKIQRERSNTVDSMDSIDVASIKPKETNEPRKRAGRKKEKKEVAPEEEEEEDIDEESSKVAIVKTYSSTGLDLENFVQSKSRVLELSDAVLGYGSHGTVVYKGQFDGREVAVKRLLLDFYDVALKEVKLLQESDDHPNVVRYFYKEESDRFLYIALELCYGSLNDYMERSLPLPEMQLCDTMNNANILSQMTCGIQYLHSLKIVHRDIKPHNILLAPSKNRFAKNSPPVRILISDFGLCKKLDGEQSSFNYTAASPAGTSGWRAPELLAWALAAPSSDTSLSSGRESSSDPNLMMGRVKATRAIDIFSTGCVFYYVLSGGDHPFGNRFGRENNILQGLYDLSKLDSMGEDGVEAKDLVERMISVEPKQR